MGIITWISLVGFPSRPTTWLCLYLYLVVKVEVS